VVSNWDIGLREQLHGLGLLDVPIVASGEVGAAKPDPAVFRHALELLGARPDRTLHVGDSEADADGARAAGMHFAPAPLAAAVEGLS
jgi:HAD superfamily hydrolase (TIGR01549 family)